MSDTAASSDFGIRRLRPADLERVIGIDTVHVGVANGALSINGQEVRSEAA